MVSGSEVPLVMPKMSMTMTEGILVEWCLEPGDEVSAGDVVCVVSTDKVDMDVESPVDGTLTRLTAHPDDVVPVGTPLAYLQTESESLLDPETLIQSVEQADSVGSAHRFSHSGRSVAAGSWPVAVPLARRLARERGVDLAAVAGTGPGGVIRVADLPGAAATRRDAFARSMTASLAVPQVVAYREIDFTELAAARAGLGWTGLLARAFAGALRADPVLNARFEAGRATRLDSVGVAVAVPTPRGPLAPVLRDPDGLPARELDARLRALAGRARLGRLSAADLGAAGGTLTNLGGRGVDAFETLVTPPQATALTVGTIGPKPVVVGGAVAVRVRGIVGLAVDCRVGDGTDAARLLAELARRVADPATLGLLAEVAS
ncbi:dihydrolipoamide acetyltransferase family protein [Pseudonocardia eucalypti]|uniref:Dihydrolipoamide acetyltransferase component of pyruvate dehydrogenase complex n=1 Tax=Pseudonocardia eucalypti TaxID=648755 RepID=A0ABP9RC69_9PSEU|nr:pyruvate dehydrogenase E2 component (dihydrolipoamide acetyltransferase) [Pseudonocardia eucalypti]